MKIDRRVRQQPNTCLEIALVTQIQTSYGNMLNDYIIYGIIFISRNSFYSDNVIDPMNTIAGINSKRVRRGGSWNYHSATLLTYARASDFENRGNNHFGFRIVKN